MNNAITTNEQRRRHDIFPPANASISPSLNPGVPTGRQDWLSLTPTMFINWTFMSERRGGFILPMNVTYSKFKLIFFILKGEDMLVWSSPDRGGQTIPYSSFAVLQHPELGDLQRFEVLPPQASAEPLRDRIRGVLHTLTPEPAIRNAVMLQELDPETWPYVRRILREPDLGSEFQNWECEMELSIILSVQDLSVGNGPRYKWWTQYRFGAVTDWGQIVLGTTNAHIKKMFLEHQRLWAAYLQGLTERRRQVQV